MERKTKRLLSLLLALVMVISMIPATVFAEEAEDDPNTEGTEEYEAYIMRGEEEVQFETLEDALKNAEANERIFLYETVTEITLEESITTKGQVAVDFDVVIAAAEGVDITLTRAAELTSCMFYVRNYDTANLTLKNLTLDGNRTAAANEESMIINYGKLTMDNVNIKNTNTSKTTLGGAIYMKGEGDTLTINGGTFQNNTAVYGGALYIGAGATVTINDGTFTGNKAKYGGVVYNLGTLIIDDGIFTGNSTTNASGCHGGVIYTESNVTINDGTFGGTEEGEGNKTLHSSTAGGVIYHQKAGKVTINGGDFINNTAPSAGGVYFSANGSNGVCTLDINGGTFIGNTSTAGGNGGAIYNHNLNQATIDDATFIGNTGVNGGALFNSDTGTLTVTNCTFTENVATGTNGGGAVFVKGTVTINSSEFDGNQAAKGGAVYIHNQAAAKLNINGGTFTDNTATDSSDMYLTNGTTTITGEVKGVAITVATNAKQLNVSGTADLTDTVVTGKVAVAANGVLTVGGAFSATGVNLAAGAKLNVGTALTNNVALTSAVNEVGTVLVTAPAGELAAAVEKMTCDFGSDTLILSPETGAIYLTGYGAVIDGTGYETLADAIAAAQSGKTILLQANAADELVVIPAGVTLNLNGYVVDADYFAAFGSVIDTMATGGLEIAKGSATTMLREDNAYLPLYDTTNGCYKFYAYELKSVDTPQNSTAKSAQFWFTVNFANEDAYALLADADAAGMYLSVEVSWDNTTIIADILQTSIDDWCALGNEGGVYVAVYGLDKVGEVTVTPILKTSTAVNATGTAITHDVAEEV